MRLNIKFDDEELRRSLQRLVRLGTDFSPFTRRAAGHLEDSFNESFERQGSPEGAWTPLDPKTVKQRERLGFGAGPILERQGDLLRSITSEWDSRSAVAGTNLKYAATHQFGDQSRNIPARPFLNIWPEHERMIVDDLARLITSEWG